MANDSTPPQIELERDEIENAPTTLLTQLGGQVGRCYWCGRVGEVVYVDTIHGTDRYKGVTCCGGRHV